MASVASALLAGIAGLFVVTGSAEGDRRVVLAGFRPRQVLAGHLSVVAAAAVVTTAVSLAVSAAFFSPRLWPEYAGADLLIALTYAMVGVLLGPLVGRLGGLYVILLLAIVDVGYGQTVMFHPLPPTWGAFFPARGAGRLLYGSFTTSFEQYANLGLALAWLGALTVAAAFTFRHQIGVKVVRRIGADSAPQLPRGAGPSPRPDDRSQPTTAAQRRQGVVQVPELLSPRYRNRVLKVSCSYRNAGVEYEPEKHKKHTTRLRVLRMLARDGHSKMKNPPGWEGS
jgi:hypothetical protein